MKLDELEQVMKRVSEVEDHIIDIYQKWPEARKLDQIRGIGLIERFVDSEELIAYAGFAPGIRQSDGTSRAGHIGGSGTDTHLRFYLSETSVCARQIPRYKPTYERMAAKRAKKIGRLVVARMLLRSIHKMLREDVAFDTTAAA